MSSAARANIERVTGRSWIVPFVGGLMGGVVMTASLGPSIVDPRNYEWLMHGDYALHFLGWHFYRHGPWTLPLGATPLLIAPIGSSIGLTDSIPVLAIPLKVLAPLLPPVFQFIGLWLVLCFVLQGVFGVLLMRLVTPRPSLQLIGAALLILSPPLIYRIVHAALTAHWVVLAALWLALRTDAGTPTARFAAAWAALSAVTAATQPYLLMMVAVLMLAAYARQAVSSRRLVVTAAHAAIGLAAALLALWQSGSLMVSGDEGLEIGGFGAWSSNLLAFVMPTEGPTLFSPGPFRYEHPEQYEGYAYLGAGTLLLGSVVLIARVRVIRSPMWWSSVLRHGPLMLAVLFLSAMAVGPRITMGSETVWTYDPSWWGPLKVFRTSGRMIWPAYYGLVVAILFAACRFPYRRAVVVSALALLVQAVDVASMARSVRDVQSFGFRDPLASGFWDVVLPHYRSLVLIPPNLCDEAHVDFLPFALRAGVNGMSINSGMTARVDVRKARAYCQDLNLEIREGLRSETSLFVVRLDLVPYTLAQAKGGLTCTAVDGFGVCFTSDSHSRWREAFDIARSRLPAIEELVRFHHELDEVYRTVLNRPAAEVPGTTDTRVEALARYLGYRIEGCTHSEAEWRALQSLSGSGESATCPHVALQHHVPPPDDTYTFRRRLEEWLRTRPDLQLVQTHVDAEGEAVWLQTYARERARGANEAAAWAVVRSEIRRVTTQAGGDAVVGSKVPPG